MSDPFGAGARDLFGVELPIVLGPMSGGPSTPQLVAAVSGAGGLGFLGEGYAPPEQIHRDIGAVRSLTDRPFGVNLFVPGDVAVDAEQIARAVELLLPYRAELGLPTQTVPAAFAEDFEQQLAAVLSERIPVVTFTFGLPDAGVVAELRRAGTVVGGTATTPDEARAWEVLGVDFVVAQGAEAGGHRATFLASAGDDLIGTSTLVNLVRATTDLPVVAAGGITDGRGVASALVRGACAAQLGTAFLLCPESGTSEPYRRAVRRATATDTVITSVFSGRRARGIVNRFARELQGHDLPPYPIQNALTRELRQAAAQRGDEQLLSLWAGQGVELVEEQLAAVLVARLAAEARAASAEAAGEGTLR